MKRGGQGRRRVVALVFALAAVGSPASAGAASANGGAGPYFTAPFTVETNAHTFGQDPSWTPDGRVLSSEPDPAGVEQVYRSDLDGSHATCVTCGQTGPNGFAQERPQGDWILFCSWRGQTVTFGKPCLGGIGTDLYAMRTDGSDVTRLTVPGMAFEAPGVAFDNYHPAWSPDGTEVVWTHIGFDDLSRGGTQWTMLVSDFDQAGRDRPRLSNVRVVGPATDTGYETQVWAPDGSGFLYTAMGRDRSGWMNLELYFMRLAGHGATARHPVVSHLTDDSPAWDEQAVFTPDMKDVVWMSSRGSPSWYQTVVTAAQQTGFDPPLQNETFGPMFVLTIADPGFHTDLYELDLATRATRRLTDLNRIVPEFYFDPSGRRLLWSEGGNGSTIVGHFRLATTPSAVGPWVRPLAPAPGPGSGVSPAPTSSAHGGAPSSGSLPGPVVQEAVVLEGQLGQLTEQLQGLPQGSSCCRAAAGSNPTG